MALFQLCGFFTPRGRKHTELVGTKNYQEFFITFPYMKNNLQKP